MKTFLFIFLFSSFSLAYAQSGTAGKGKSYDNFIEFNAVPPQVGIYPNPAITVTKIDLKKGSKKNLTIEEVSIYSMLGNQVFHKTYKGVVSLDLNVQNFKKGRYLVRLLLSDKTTQVVSLLKV